MIRPSSLPMLAQCACFESSGSDFAELGTDRHAALKAHFIGDDSLLDLLDEEDQAGVRWATDYIRANTTASYPVIWERKLHWTRPDFSEAEGTPDVVNGPEIFDFKWRYRNYEAQMADYAWAVMELGNFESVTVHLLFGANKRSEKLRFDREACDRVIAPILDGMAKPVPKNCEYCGWCAKQFTCPANTGPALRVAEGYAEPNLLDMVRNWHPSEMIADAEQIALALTIWRRILKKWGDSVEYHAMEAATKQGLKLPGFELKEKRGKQFVADVQAAFAASGLSAEQFLSTCAVRLNTSKKYPDNKGLDTVFKEAFGEASTAAAKRSVEKKLGDLIQRTKASLQLVSTKGNEVNEGEAE